MLNAHWWAKCLCLPQENGDAAAFTRSGLIRLDVEESSSPLPPALWQIRERQKTILKACFNSAFILLGAILIGLSVSLIDRSLTIWPQETSQQRLERFHSVFLKAGCNKTLDDHLRELTKDPHVAGTQENFATAEYVLSTFQRYGLAAHYTDYSVLLSYPLERNLSLIHPNGSVMKFSLQEQPADGDAYTKNAKVIPTFHAYSPSGNVEGEVVYVNYGRDEDYELLRHLGVNASGAIVLARYGQVYRGDIVGNAAKAGAVAAIIYSDPADYAGNGTEGHYPDSSWLPPSGVQRGTVYQGIGDPLTPGWPSTKYAERISASDPAAGLPRIPSLPISAQEAKPILMSLSGPVAPKQWQGGLHLPEYKVGRGPGKLNYRYVANQTVAAIRNVLAVIKGYEEPDRFILLGNHRDAWTFGAVDPNSGTAALLEIANRLGRLVKGGWKPRRTIVLCSWDAEEYGMVGSTEWVEHNLDILGARAVAYLNVDCAVSGPGFFAAATPQLDDLLMDAARKVKDPDSPRGTLYDSWVAASGGSSPSIDRLGNAGSDYVAFLQHAGVPSIDVYFGKSYPVYHSLYDNYNWMKLYGDPFFHRHLAVSSLWGLVALRLADFFVLPFNYVVYATELKGYGKTVETALWAGKAPQNVTASPLRAALAEMLEAATHVGEESKNLFDALSTRELSLLLPRRTFNDRLMLAERAFLEMDGLPGRSWYKHLVYGPTKNNKYGTTAFPGILDAIAEATSYRTPENWAAVQHEIWRVSRVVSRAAVVLRGDLM